MRLLTLNTTKYRMILKYNCNQIHNPICSSRYQVNIELQPHANTYTIKCRTEYKYIYNQIRNQLQIQQNMYSDKNITELKYSQIMESNQQFQVKSILPQSLKSEEVCKLYTHSHMSAFYE